MRQSMSRKRPWLAALLGAVATGLGHLYLRRWRRAVGWLAVLFGVTALFVEPEALNAMATGEAFDPLAVAPTLVVGLLSVLDAYVLARAQNEVARRTATPDEELVHCPNCGKEVDPDLDFCQWCTEELPTADEEQPDDVGGRVR